MKTYLPFLAIALMLVILGGCSEDSMTVAPTNVLSGIIVGPSGEFCTTLIAGQTINAGQVCAEVDGPNLLVTYTTTGGWELVEAHLFVGDCKCWPQTRTGNPQVGLFPYNSGNITGATSFTFTVPLSAVGVNAATFCDDPNANKLLYVAAHCALRKLNADGSYQTQTGWGNGSPMVSKGNWAMYFDITLTCLPEPPGPGGELCNETAWAYGGNAATCFIDLGEFSRWGWTNGPLGTGTYVYDIYAGAGQCELSKGTKVGKLTVAYDGATATVTYGMNSGFTLTQTHLYVGSEILPRDNQGDYTVAPGQFPYKHGSLNYVTSDTYTVTGLSGNIYVVAHAQAYGTYASCSGSE